MSEYETKPRSDGNDKARSMEAPTMTPKPKQHAAMAGPSQDDRFGAGPIASSLLARIIRHEVSNGRTRIAIARGREHGVRLGMEGYIKTGLGMLCEFQIDEVKNRVSYAFIDVTTKELGGHHTVVINPSSKPRVPVPSDLRTRVIGVEVEGSTTKIDLARGSAHGVRAGLRGYLLSEDGREGPDFEIGHALAIRSAAYLTATVDQVNQHQLAVINPSASRAVSPPVQRRPTGAAATANVQPTAQAGVAGAASPLPHLDAIQRSFGKYDVSGVQAQVGGPATQASQALGAQAYATGNKVAFASSPDLHTAAHEAAHTIQQKHGVVGFQGLGAADDTHEHHADKIADAVVAGQSAEPLLDQIPGGGTASNEAVQRKPARSPTRSDADTLVKSGKIDAEPSVPDASRPSGPSGVDFVDHGPHCKPDAVARPGCHLDAGQRASLLLVLSVRIGLAAGAYRDALAAMRVDELLKKEQDLPMYVNIALDMIAGFTAARLGIAIAGLAAQGKNKLVTIAHEARLDGDFDHWTNNASDYLKGISSKGIEGQVKAAVGAAKPIASNGAKDAVNFEEQSTKEQNVSIIEQFANSANIGFNNVFEQAAGHANDVELLALLDSFDPRHHTITAYKVALLAKLDRLDKSGVKQIGRSTLKLGAEHRHVNKVTNDRGKEVDARAFDVQLRRVAWGSFLSGYPRQLVWADHYHTSPSREPRDPHTGMSRSTWPRPAFDPELPNTTKQQRFGGFVPDEFNEMALARHRAVWGGEPGTLDIDDRIAYQWGDVKRAAKAWENHKNKLNQWRTDEEAGQSQQDQTSAVDLNAPGMEPFKNVDLGDQGK